MRTQLNKPMTKWRKLLRPVVRESSYKHDPLLILSMAAFNFCTGWQRVVAQHGPRRPANWDLSFP
jgi:hypothetical protein